VKLSGYQIIGIVHTLEIIPDETSKKKTIGGIKKTFIDLFITCWTITHRHDCADAMEFYCLMWGSKQKTRQFNQHWINNVGKLR
jgi:hypothetical protein